MFPQQTSIPKSTCNIQIQPTPQTAVSSSPAQAEHLHNIPPPNTDGVPCTFRNKRFQQTDLTPNTTAVMTESQYMPPFHTSVTPTRFNNRVLASHSRQNITQSMPLDADMDHHQSQGQLIHPDNKTIHVSNNKLSKHVTLGYVVYVTEYFRP